jgi:hypothetical protein
VPIQFSTSVRNSRLDAIETTIGASPTLEIREGSPPANCAAADSGTVLATVALPADWMAAAASGAKAFSGTWEDTSSDASGTAGHFRIKQGGTCHMQGTVGTSGTDMTVTNATFTAGQPFEITGFTLTDGNA